MEYKLECPLSREKLKMLRAGDRVLLSGRIYTARDAAHKRLCALLDDGAALPFPLEDSVIYSVCQRTRCFVQAKHREFSKKGKKKAKIEERQELSQLQFASFFRFMAAYLSLTQFATWARPRWCV